MTEPKRGEYGEPWPYVYVDHEFHPRTNERTGRLIIDAKAWDRSRACVNELNGIEFEEGAVADLIRACAARYNIESGYLDSLPADTVSGTLDIANERLAAAFGRIRIAMDLSAMPEGLRRALEAELAAADDTAPGASE